MEQSKGQSTPEGMTKVHTGRIHMWNEVAVISKFYIFIQSRPSF